MARRIVAVFTLSAFIIFSSSCLVYKVKQEPFEAIAKKESKPRILALQTKARDYFEFRPDRRATFSGGALVGECLKTVEFKQEDIEEMTILPPVGGGEILTKDGEQYTVRTTRPAGDSLICQAYLPVSIPLPEIQLAWVKSFNSGGTILYTVGFVAFCVVVIPLLLLVPELFDGDDMFTFTVEFDFPSPPDVYLDFWENYFVDSELHGPTSGQGFTMTEWTAAENITAPGGKCRVFLRNELDEPKAIDELKIFVVDHPPGLNVIPDLLGKMHTVPGAAAPRKAFDRHGRDIQTLVAAKDSQFWMTSDAEKSPRKKEDLRDELIFEFLKPEGVKKAKLLVNTTNTAWASDFASSFLLVPGTGRFEQLPLASGPDLSGGRARDWYREDEFYRLRVWVETKNGWETRQMIYGGGPFVPRDMIYTMDIGDIPGSTLKVKLMPPVGFWMIDRLAVDYSKDKASRPVEFMAEEASVPDLSTEDVLTALNREDGECLMLSNRGDTVEIAFTAPLLPKGKERSVILKTVCRYEIRPDVGGTGR